MKMRRNSLSAFTLIELIISSLIFACAAGAVYGVFSGGIAAWKKGSSVNSYERKLRIVSESMARQMRNALRVSVLPFTGSSNSVSFACLIEDTSAEDAGYAVGRVSYFLNDEGCFCSGYQSYPEVFLNKACTTKELIPGVQGIGFSYFGFNRDLNGYDWFDSWQEPVPADAEEENDADKEDNKEDEAPIIPKAVKITFELQDAGEEVVAFTKTIIIPVGDDIEPVIKED
jgi:type II secretory pathway pseudopilin PulG